MYNLKDREYSEQPTRAPQIAVNDYHMAVRAAQHCHRLRGVRPSYAPGELSYVAHTHTHTHSCGLRRNYDPSESEYLTPPPIQDTGHALD